MLILVVASIPAFITEARLSNQSFRLNSWRAPEARRLNYLEWVLTRDTHVKEVKLFAIGRLILDRYRALFEKFYREDRALARTRFVYGLLLTLLSLGAFYACYAFAARRAAPGGMTLGDLTLYVIVFRQGQSAFQSVLGGVAGLYEDALFMSNLFAYLDLPADDPHSNGVTRAWPVDAALRTLKGFRTSRRRSSCATSRSATRARRRWALRDVSLTIAPGEVIALVGDNGAGKSTLIHLLMRMYEPTEGEILYGGRPLREIPTRRAAPPHRRRVPGLRALSVHASPRTSASAGCRRSRTARASRRRPARAAPTRSWRACPSGYETMLGGYFEAGQELSVGQWQKIAIARAFMRDAEVLILDEPTASLDAEAEHEMWKRFKALAQRTHGDPDQPPHVDGAPGRAHRRAARRPHRGAGQPRRAAGARRPLRPPVPPASRRIPGLRRRPATA